MVKLPLSFDTTTSAKPFPWESPRKVINYSFDLFRAVVQLTGEIDVWNGLEFMEALGAAIVIQQKSHGQGSEFFSKDFNK